MEGRGEGKEEREEKGRERGRRKEGRGERKNTKKKEVDFLRGLFDSQCLIGSPRSRSSFTLATHVFRLSGNLVKPYHTQRLLKAGT